MGQSRYSIGLVKRDGTPYQRTPAQRYWSNARFGLLDRKGEVRRVLDGIPFTPETRTYLEKLLQKNPTLKTFIPALKVQKTKKKSLQEKLERNELVIVSLGGRLLRQLPKTNTLVYYGIRSGDNVNIINVPMKYRGYLLKDKASQKQRPQRFSKSRWTLLKKFFKTNSEGITIFYLDNLGRIRPPEYSVGKYKRVKDEEKDKMVLKRGDGLCGAEFTVKDAQFKIWLGANFMELDTNDFINRNKKLNMISRSNDYSKIPDLKLSGNTVREAVRNVSLNYTEKQWITMQQKFGTLEFDFIGYFREGERKIGFNGGGSLKGNLFDFQKDLAKQIVDALAQTGNRFTTLTTLKNIDAKSRMFEISPQTIQERNGEEIIVGASPEVKKQLRIRSRQKSVQRESLQQITSDVFIKIRIITQ